MQLLTAWPARSWPLGLDLWVHLRPAIDDADVELHAVASNERLVTVYARFGFQPVTGQPARRLIRPARAGISG